jgi:C-terminal processing protease CtpA/Prc
MMRIIKTCLVFMLLVFGAAPAGSQDFGKKELKQVIDTITQLVERHYVFPEKGKTIASEIVDRYRKGAYNSINTWKALDSILTLHLQEVSNDGHLYTGYDPQIVKDLLAPPGDAVQIQAGSNKGAETNFGFKEVKVLDDNIGYLKLDRIQINTESLLQLYAAMQFVSHTKALVIDLRNNGGGGSDVGAVFQSFFLPPNIPLLEFATRNGNSFVESTVPWLTEKRYNKPLYILINRKTASAAEAFAFSLQHQKRAVIVGSPSAGAAHMNTWYPINNFLYLSVSTAAPVLPGTRISWERKGVKPDLEAKEGEELDVVRKAL